MCRNCVKTATRTIFLPDPAPAVFFETLDFAPSELDYAGAVKEFEKALGFREGETAAERMARCLLIMR